MPSSGEKHTFTFGGNGMTDSLLLGVSRYLLPIPRFIWQ